MKKPLYMKVTVEAIIRIDGGCIDSIEDYDAAGDIKSHTVTAGPFKGGTVSPCLGIYCEGPGRKEFLSANTDEIQKKLGIESMGWTAHYTRITKREAFKATNTVG